MKKIILISVLTVFIGMAGISQSFEKGSQAINLGIGFGNTNYWNSYYYGFLPSFSASYEYGIVEIPMGSRLNGVISIGGYMGVSVSKYGYDNWENDNYYMTSNFIMAFRGNYHFIFHDKFDPYAGIAIGFDMSTWKWKGNDSDPGVDNASVNFYGGPYAGARYFFSDKFAVYAELGWLISVVNVGVTFKF